MEKKKSTMSQLVVPSPPTTAHRLSLTVSASIAKNIEYFSDFFDNEFLDCEFLLEGEYFG